MPQPDELQKLAELADEFLISLRKAAIAVASGETGSGSGIATDVTDKASRFTAAAARSPDLARAVEASPGLAALSLASKPLHKLASKNPELAQLAVASPYLAQIAAKAPEMAELAKASPALAASIEAALGRLK
ncbi:hypothetical protein GOC60_32515 [Sinorhizobium meliloti]|nr:hypothetical protein [Sinorhizobium meliloti]MDX0265781.1 hypothetical protein [Sinorhizobium meliloti]MDX0353221.1 hypothetical protein [Sinorhizobium meliloti]